MAKNKKACADIGCDHGKIAVSLALDGGFVYAVDISEPSLEKAKLLAEQENVSGQMAFYCDSGLKSIKDINLDVAIIAGMGWRTIKSILEANKEYLQNIGSFILQPMDSVFELRGYIEQSGYKITDERLAKEDNRYYSIIEMKTIGGGPLTIQEKILGPVILAKKDPLLDEYAKKEIEKREDILKAIKSSSKDNSDKIKKIEHEIKLLINI
ncbi:MAG: SAM-dependent methyltransferase [Clostridia bacterium]|nr:SAM-dependent methyltransferase [Clostridia bacterium]